MAELKAELTRLREHEEPLTSARRYYARRWWRAHRRSVKRATVATAALAVVGGSALWVRHEHTLAARAPAAAVRLSLAVVPLHSGGPRASGLDAATQEALTTESASGDQVRVVPPASVAEAMRDLKLSSSAKLSAQQIADLGRLLNVDYLLEESATATPDRSGGTSRFHLAANLDRVRGQQPMSDQSLDVKPRRAVRGHATDRRESCTGAAAEASFFGVTESAASSGPGRSLLCGRAGSVAGP